MPTKTRRSGGRRMWETVHAMGHSTFYLTEKEPKDAAKYLKRCGYPAAKIGARPLLVLDLSPDAVQALRETIAKILFETGRGSGEIWGDQTRFMKQASYVEADAILTALGALPVTKRNHARE